MVMDQFRGIVLAQVNDMKAKLGEVLWHLTLCKIIIALSVSTSKVPRVRVLDPPKFGGKQDAKEVDNFLAMIKHHFDAIQLHKDELKIDITALYFDGNATL